MSLWRRFLEGAESFKANGLCQSAETKARLKKATQLWQKIVIIFLCIHKKVNDLISFLASWRLFLHPMFCLFEMNLKFITRESSKPILSEHEFPFLILSNSFHSLLLSLHYNTFISCSGKIFTLTLPNFYELWRSETQREEGREKFH